MLTHETKTNSNIYLFQFSAYMLLFHWRYFYLSYTLLKTKVNCVHFTIFFGTFISLLLKCKNQTTTTTNQMFYGEFRVYQCNFRLRRDEYCHFYIKFRVECSSFKYLVSEKIISMDGSMTFQNRCFVYDQKHVSINFVC